MADATVIFRKARREDLPHLVKMLFEDELGAKREKWSDPLPSAYSDAFDAIDADPKQELIVGDLAGRIIGTLQITYLRYLNFQGSLAAHIESVRIVKDLRGQRLGEQMMNWAIARAKEKGCHRVQLMTHQSRVEARRFYERLGLEATHWGMKRLL